MPTALITGASRGLGAAFAARLAADGFDLVLVARDRAALEQVAVAARGAGVDAQVLVADLTDEKARREVQRMLADPQRPVDMLVNNAGIEAEREFLHSDLCSLQAEIDVNVTAVMQLSHAALPGMIARGNGAVVNIASFAGYLAARGRAYAASKAWVLAFTDTIAPSLAGTGVGMIAVCAGRMRTGRIEAPAGPSPLWLDPAEVVDTCLRDLAKGRSLCTPGWLYRGVVGVLELPRRTLRQLAKASGRGRTQRADHGPTDPDAAGSAAGPDPDTAGSATAHPTRLALVRVPRGAPAA